MKLHSIHVIILDQKCLHPIITKATHTFPVHSQHGRKLKLGEQMQKSERKRVRREYLCTCQCAFGVTQVSVRVCMRASVCMCVCRRARLHACADTRLTSCTWAIHYYRLPGPCRKGMSLSESRFVALLQQAEVLCVPHKYTPHTHTYNRTDTTKTTHSGSSPALGPCAWCVAALRLVRSLLVPVAGLCTSL